MKRTIKSFLIKSILMVGLIFIMNSLHAQGQPATAEEMANREVARMKTDLSLSSEQEQSVKAIILKYETQKKEVRDASKEDREGARTKMAELDKKKDEEIKAVLTDDQYQKLQAKKSEMHNRGNGKSKGKK